jgi:hypothetical protein
MSQVKRAFAVLCSSVMLAFVAASPAAAANQRSGDNLVNLQIGDITVQDINVNVAAQVFAAVCGTKVGPVAILANQVDAGGSPTITCPNHPGDVTITNN